MFREITRDIYSNDGKKIGISRIKYDAARDVYEGNDYDLSGRLIGSWERDSSGRQTTVPVSDSIKDSSGIKRECRCVNCNKEIDETYRFCPFCGKNPFTKEAENIPDTGKGTADNKSYKIEKSILHIDKEMDEDTIYKNLDPSVAWKIERVSADQDNPYVALKDGILYTKDMKKILFVPGEMEGYAVIPDTVESTDRLFRFHKKLTGICLPYGITELKNGELCGCESLKEMDVPETVEDLGESCFEGCIALESVTLPDNVEEIKKKTFFDCRALKTIVFPKTLRTIGKEAFRDCGSLESVILPESVSRIEEQAFFGCSSVKKLYIPGNIEDISKAFNDFSSLEEIKVSKRNQNYIEKDGVLYKREEKELTVVAFPVNRTGKYIFDRNVTAVMTGAFRNCRIESVRFKNRDVVLFPYAFDGCRDLINIDFGSNSGDGCVEIPDSTIFNGAFDASYNRYQLSGADRSELKYGPAKVNRAVFSDCRKIKSVKIPAALKEIAPLAFAGCSSLENVVFDHGSKMERLCDGCFIGCGNLKKIDLPSGLRTIGNFAFAWCDGLETVKIPDGVETIEDYAFAWCTGMKEVFIPKSVKTIGQGAFRGCSAKISAPEDSYAEEYLKENYFGLGIKCRCGRQIDRKWFFCPECAERTDDSDREINEDGTAQITIRKHFSGGNGVSASSTILYRYDTRTRKAFNLRMSRYLNIPDNLIHLNDVKGFLKYMTSYCR